MGADKGRIYKVKCLRFDGLVPFCRIRDWRRLMAQAKGAGTCAGGVGTG